MDRRGGFIALLASAVIYAFSGILIRYASLSFGTFAQTALRGLAGLVFFGIYFVFARKKITIPANMNKLKLVIYLITPAFSIACAILSIGMIKASNTIFYIYAGILISSLFYSLLLYKEKFTKVKLIALVLSVIGIFVMSYPLAKVTLLGAVLGIIPGILDSTGNAMIKYLGKFDSDSLILLQRVSTTLLGVLMFFVFAERFPVAILPASIWAVLALGLGMVLIVSLYFYGFKNFDLNLGNIVTSAELIIMLALNAIFLREYPNLGELFGAGLIFLALFIISWQAFREEKFRSVAVS